MVDWAGSNKQLTNSWQASIALTTVTRHTASPAMSSGRAVKTLTTAFTPGQKAKVTCTG